MAIDKKTKQAIIEYCLRIGDDALILGQRLGEWCGHAHVLEEDIALTNISLDLIGRARNFYAHAAKLENAGRDEDAIAFRRTEVEFKNCLMTELPNGDFAMTTLKQFFYDTYSYYFFEALQQSKYDVFEALAVKSLKEVSYHTRHSSEWIVRLGDGTAESKQRCQSALYDIWRFTDDMFYTNETDALLLQQGIGVDMDKVRSKWTAMATDILTRATLSIPDNTFQVTGGRNGKHTEHLGYILAEMQFLPRAYPDAKW